MKCPDYNTLGSSGVPYIDLTAGLFVSGGGGAEGSLPP